jgi:hypothetical protein
MTGSAPTVSEVERLKPGLKVNLPRGTFFD